MSTMKLGMQATGSKLSARPLSNNRNASSIVVKAVGQEVRQESGAEEIYLGFPKGDYAPREGRKGRVIKDDPKKYPNKEDMGLFIGATGGWAGGEAALVKLRDNIKEEMSSTKQAASKPAAKASSTPAAPQPGQVPIYVGFGKDELDLRKAGEKGRVIYDDAVKYPAKDDIGFLAGATGGFAGGERGLRGFVETGEVRIRKAGEPGGQPMSPLTTGFLVIAAGLTGAALVSTITSSSEGLQATGLDGFTLNVLVGAVALAVVGGGAVAIRYAQENSKTRS